MELDLRGIRKPNPGGQADFVNDWDHFMCAAEGGWMSGKTWAGARKLLTLHLCNAFFPAFLQQDDPDAEPVPHPKAGQPTFVPGVNVAPTFSNAMDFCVPELLDACKECGLAVRFRGHGTLPGGRYYGPALILSDLGTRGFLSVILVRTADAPDRITGFQVGHAWGDEPARWREDRNDPKNDPLTQLLARVRHPDANLLQVLFTYTNEGDATRIYEEVREGKTDRAYYRIRTKENPVAEGFYERQSGLLTLELAEQYLEGGAISLRGGKIYRSFNKKKHVSRSVRLRRDEPLMLMLDFNVAPGMHGEIGQYDEAEDIFRVVHEIHEHRMTVKDFVAVFGDWVGKMGGWQWPVLDVYGDASGRAASVTTGETCYDILEQGLVGLKVPFVLHVPVMNPPEVDRVNSVEVALCDLKKKSHVLIHPRCIRLLEDLRRLKRDERGRIDKRDRNLSHPSDAFGYAVWWVRPIRVPHGDDVGGRISVTVG